MRTSISIRLSPPWPDKISVLQNVQQLGLQAQRHFGDFVQKQRAALAEFEFARLGASVVVHSEQFALQHIARQGGAIDLEEAKAGAHREFVNQARRQILAGAVLARDEHGRAAPAPAVPLAPAILRMVGLAATKNMSSPICSISSAAISLSPLSPV